MKSSDATLIMPMYTNNQSNDFALNGLPTTRVPLCAIVMEMEVRMGNFHFRLDVSWAPRDYNEEKRTSSPVGTARYSARDKQAHFNLASLLPMHGSGHAAQDFRSGPRFVNFVKPGKVPHCRGSLDGRGARSQETSCAIGIGKVARFVCGSKGKEQRSLR